MNVKIYGAGSIGNHLAHGCRNKGWEVLICDTDPKALERTQQDIYPARYGQWDAQIRLCTPEDLPHQEFDLVIIGTPPDSHLALAKSELTTRPPKVLLLEKPVCTPSLEDAQHVLDLAQHAGTVACVGYNHTLTANTQAAEAVLAQQQIGTPITISAKFREHWGGIFRAHPWLAGPQDTYLGFWERGGGASGEHSHAINIWQHFARACKLGRIVEVSAMLEMVKDETGASYDRVCLIHVKTEQGFVGDIAQDVVTEPAQKQVRIQGDQGYLEWFCNIESGYDAVISWDGNQEPETQMIAKTRPDDFKGELDHLEQILTGRANPSTSPIALERGLDTMLVIAAAHLSNQHGRAVKLDYEAGYCRDALELV
ncbi:gfo/Idh/MocA family oxidoreductase [candidate division KSB3 bacterium]|uniref:Gfo/Idh/MocA family oxidoreductase n=1 Tax=candidate division KSB3 bacterium TaxID=2044937 RepID=A0A9D5Q889_9BACT|nr:gfo/Idh/MocA family oxidoreductase [candidate division KSB3 bacterium]MBD3326656.1 gfo/Idh/MocA family oxidoreductase [candidate division KSB3 bacterium]